MTILPFPRTCREYLGAARGYCPARAVMTAEDGRGFCRRHADERGLP